MYSLGCISGRRVCVCGSDTARYIVTGGDSLGYAVYMCACMYGVRDRGVGREERAEIDMWPEAVAGPSGLIDLPP